MVEGVQQGPVLVGTFFSPLHVLCLLCIAAVPSASSPVSCAAAAIGISLTDALQPHVSCAMHRLPCHCRFILHLVSSAAC